MRQSEFDPNLLRSLIASLNVLLAQDIADDAVRCAVIAKRLSKALQPGWLPTAALISGQECYQRHLLHQDPAGRFSIGSFVWRPGQQTPIHDHYCWGVMGVLHGRLISENYVAAAGGGLRHTSSLVLPAGYTAWLAPAYGDIHRIANRATEATAVSIHIYGAPFAAICRNRYDDAIDLPDRDNVAGHGSGTGRR